MKKQFFLATPADLRSLVMITLNYTDNLLAQSTPVPFLYLTRVRIHLVLIEFEDRFDISSTHDLAALAKELQGQKWVTHHT